MEVSLLAHEKKATIAVAHSELYKLVLIMNRSGMFLT